MQIHHTGKSLTLALHPLRTEGRSIVLVPTMGNLHAGHISLVEEARRQGDAVVATIFVNPMQFGKNEDLDAYPRTMDSDKTRLQDAGCDFLFAPEVKEIYPEGLAAQTLVHVPGLSERHCGLSRPGHFDGVATVICKLFNLTAPHKAVFGLKDYQQFQVIRKLTRDLCYPIDIIGVETKREASGLAMSSRNGYLDQEQLSQAAGLFRQLRLAAEALKGNMKPIAEVEASARDALTAQGFRPDYFTVCHAETLAPASSGDEDLVILAAAWLGNTRLIDNIRLHRDQGLKKP